MLTRLPDFGTLDRIVLLLVLAWFMTLWQEVYRLANPNRWLFRVGSTFLVLAALTTLAALLSLTWRRFLRARSLTATTVDFASSLIWTTGILSLVVASVTLLLPAGYTTFHLDGDFVQESARRCFTFCHDIVGFNPASTAAPSACPTALATRLLLAATAALVAVAHVPAAWLASFAFVHRPRLPPRAQGNALQRLSLVMDPALSCLLCLSFLRPVSLGLLERAGVDVTAEQWLCMQVREGTNKQTSAFLPSFIHSFEPSRSHPPLGGGKQGGLLSLLIVGRLSLVRWQLQTYLEYGGVLALYEELAKCAKPEEIDTLGIRMLFQVRGACLHAWGWGARHDETGRDE